MVQYNMKVGCVKLKGKCFKANYNTSLLKSSITRKTKQYSLELHAIIIWRNYEEVRV